MASIKLEKENVRIVALDLLNDLELYGVENEEAKGLCCYVSGVLDMTNTVMRAIEDLGGK